MNELNFDDLALIEVPVSIGDKRYLLREASGNVACKYRNALLNCTVLGPEGKPQTVRNMADVEPLLVSLCLFQLLEQPDGTVKERPAQLADVRGWPNRIVKALFERAKEISELDEEEEEQESVKNGSGDTAVG